MKRNASRIIFTAAFVLIVTAVSGLLLASYGGVKDADAIAGFPSVFCPTRQTG